MTRREALRLADIVQAIEAIRDHLTKGDLSEGLVYDAVRARLIEIGEAVKGLSRELLDTEPSIPWNVDPSAPGPARFQPLEGSTRLLRQGRLTLDRLS